MNEWHGPTNAAGQNHGQGVLLLVDGTRIEVQMVNGALHGHGVITTPNGTRLEGDYVDSQYHGIWTEKKPDGTIWEQHWLHGTKVSTKVPLP
jgi:hypothetical protein